MVSAELARPASQAASNPPGATRPAAAADAAAVAVLAVAGTTLLRGRQGRQRVPRVSTTN